VDPIYIYIYNHGLPCGVKPTGIRMAIWGTLKFLGSHKGFHWQLPAGSPKASSFNFTIAVSVARCKDASAANFPIAVSVARCKDATNPICSIAVFVAGCKDATLATFLHYVSVARCRDAVRKQHIRQKRSDTNRAAEQHQTKTQKPNNTPKRTHAKPKTTHQQQKHTQLTQTHATQTNKT
jgi:hypothetical protein